MESWRSSKISKNLPAKRGASQLQPCHFADLWSCHWWKSHFWCCEEFWKCCFSLERSTTRKPKCPTRLQHGTNDTIKPFLKHLDSGNAALKLVKPISSRTPGDLKSRMTSHTISIPGSRLGCSWTQKAPSVEPSFQTQISPLDGEG